MGCGRGRESWVVGGSDPTPPSVPPRVTPPVSRATEARRCSDQVNGLRSSTRLSVVGRRSSVVRRESWAVVGRQRGRVSCVVGRGSWVEGWCFGSSDVVVGLGSWVVGRWSSWVVGRGSWVVVVGRGRGLWVVVIGRGRGSWDVGRGGSWVVGRRRRSSIVEVVGRGSWVVGRGSWVVGGRRRSSTT